MNFGDYPNYFQAACAASVKYRKYYKLIKRSAVVLLTLAVVVTVYSLQIPEYAFWAYAAVGVLLLICLILAMVLITGKYDQIYQNSLKLKDLTETATWQFVMGAEAHREDYQGRFEKRMLEILSEFESLLPFLDAAILSEKVVTPKMIALRSKSFDTKKAYYTKHRMIPIQEHYFLQAVTHHQKYKLWLLNLVMAQILAVVAIGFLMTNTSFNWSIVALITLLFSAAISWFEIHQNQVEDRHYTASLNELDVLEQRFDKISLESELADFVMASEGIITGSNPFWSVQNPVNEQRTVLV